MKNFTILPAIILLSLVFIISSSSAHAALVFGDDMESGTPASNNWTTTGASSGTYSTLYARSGTHSLEVTGGGGFFNNITGGWANRTLDYWFYEDNGGNYLYWGAGTLDGNGIAVAKNGGVNPTYYIVNDPVWFAGGWLTGTNMIVGWHHAQIYFGDLVNSTNVTIDDVLQYSVIREYNSTISNVVTGYPIDVPVYADDIYVYDGTPQANYSPSPETPAIVNSTFLYYDIFNRTDGNIGATTSGITWTQGMNANGQINNNTLLFTNNGVSNTSFRENTISINYTGTTNNETTSEIDITYYNITQWGVPSGNNQRAWHGFPTYTPTRKCDVLAYNNSGNAQVFYQFWNLTSNIAQTVTMPMGNIINGNTYHFKVSYDVDGQNCRYMINGTTSNGYESIDTGWVDDRNSSVYTGVLQLSGWYSNNADQSGIQVRYDNMFAYNGTVSPPKKYELPVIFQPVNYTLTLTMNDTSNSAFISSFCVGGGVSNQCTTNGTIYAFELNNGTYNVSYNSTGYISDSQNIVVAGDTNGVLQATPVMVQPNVTVTFKVNDTTSNVLLNDFCTSIVGNVQKCTNTSTTVYSLVNDTTYTVNYGNFLNTSLVPSVAIIVTVDDETIILPTRIAVNPPPSRDFSNSITYLIMLVIPLLLLVYILWTFIDRTQRGEWTTTVKNILLWVIIIALVGLAIGILLSL